MRGPGFACYHAVTVKGGWPLGQARTFSHLPLPLGTDLATMPQRQRASEMLRVVNRRLNSANAGYRAVRRAGARGRVEAPEISDPDTGLNHPTRRDVPTAAHDSRARSTARLHQGQRLFYDQHRTICQLNQLFPCSATPARDSNLRRFRRSCASSRARPEGVSFQPSSTSIRLLARSSSATSTRWPRFGTRTRSSARSTSSGSSRVAGPLVNPVRWTEAGAGGQMRITTRRSRSGRRAGSAL